MLKIIFALVTVAMVGGVVVLATWDMPPPTATHEKIILNERFQ
jgi:hypothetical protein